MSFSYLLVSHGSSDPEPQRAVEKLAQLVRQELENRKATIGKTASDRKLAGKITVLAKNNPTLVGTASLELAPVPLHESIRQFAEQTKNKGLKYVRIVPLFLLAGVHVKEDIPTEVALAQQSLGNSVLLEIRPHLGSNRAIANLLKKKYAQLKADGGIILSHGSRRPGGNRSVEAIASELEAVAAYWSVSPSLEEKVEFLVKAGCRKIAILPYFLFPGGITKAIAASVEELQNTFPNVELILGEPLGATTELANQIVEKIAP